PRHQSTKQHKLILNNFFVNPGVFGALWLRISLCVFYIRMKSLRVPLCALTPVFLATKAPEHKAAQINFK
ncbi:MAG: hypothetical protein ACOYXB_12135, partial [Bacteroidota bacterium]